MNKNAILLLRGLLFQCRQQEKPATLTIGNAIEYAADGTSMVAGNVLFTKNDTAEFYLLYSKPFNVQTLTFFLFKVVDGQKRFLKAENTGVNSDNNYVRARFPAMNLIQQYGVYSVDCFTAIPDDGFTPFGFV